MEVIMQHARRVAMGTLVLAFATSSVALADGPESDREARATDAPAAPGAADERTRAASRGTTTAGGGTDAAHHAPAPAPAPPTTAEANAQLSRSAMSNADGADWGARLDRSQIESVQRELSSRGLYRGAVDGVVGPQTLAALQSFQAQQGLPAHARLDAQTRRALGLELDTQPVSGDETSTSTGLAPSVGVDGAQGAESAAGGSDSAPLKLETLDPRQIGALQTRLSELGFYRGAVDGKLGPGTRSALTRYFQAQAQLASRGMLTEATATSLGLETRATPATSGSNEPAATMPHPQPSTP
jgi:peptidoglycan hydrolase-like protein with peptidoglycan-binding domain